MKILSFFYHRPIAVTMVFLALLLLGIVSTFKIPVALLPEIAVGKIIVKVEAPDYSARKLENDVIKNLKLQLMQLNNASEIKTQTRNNVGIIELLFPFGTDMEMAFIETNEQVDHFLPMLPRDIERPRIMHSNANDIPLFYLTLNPAKETPEEISKLNTYARNVIVRRLEQLPGIAFVDISGTNKTEIKIIKDEIKCTSLNITNADIEESIKNVLVNSKTISLEKNNQEYKLLFQSPVQNIQDINNIIITKDGKNISLGEVCNIQKTLKTPEGYCLLNGKQALSMAIICQPGSRIGKLKKDIELLLNEIINTDLSLEYKLVNDQSRLLGLTISNLTKSLIYGTLLAFIIVYLFISNRKLSILIGISIPVSLLISVFFFNIFKLSINIISLSGLILGIGMMIDNAIIVVDNISRKYLSTCNLHDSVTKGTSEIFQALLSSVLTTTCIFVPLMFLSGISGALFYDQAIAIAIGLFVSLFVSVILLPVYYKLITPELNQKNTKINTWFENLYEKTFSAFSKRPKTIALITFVLILFGIIGLSLISRERMPEITRLNNSIYIDWNEQITSKENKERIKEIHENLKEYTINQLTWVGKQQYILNHLKEQNYKEAQSFLSFENKELQKKGLRILDSLILRSYPNAIVKKEIVPNLFDFIFTNNEADLVLKLYYNSISGSQPDKVQVLLNDLDSLLYAENRNELPTQTLLGYKINMSKLKVFNISYSSAIDEIKDILHPDKIATLSDGKEINEIIIESQNKYNEDWERYIYIKNRTGYKYSIDNLGKQTIIREWEVINADKDGEYLPYEIQNITQQKIPLEEIRATISQNEGWHLGVTGNIFNKQKLIKEMLITLLVSILLLYFILAAQFESLLQPLIILIEIPVNFAGIALLLILFKSSLNILSMIGIIVMAGIVINDSILKVDTINRYIAKGNPIDKAIHKAGLIRLRPILMTSFTTILALSPFLFGQGLGNELQKPMALAIIGGLGLGTIISSLFVPFYYKYLYHLSNRKKK